ncbi:unnamed protein product [Coffea canephora]|uniref:Uncharacterized protein n=1 Tax=Coffea canephora TaxID=49390 RepID=A0A068USU8_COFCA|nr:unnamed protein product [Coffea canephora]
MIICRSKWSLRLIVLKRNNHRHAIIIGITLQGVGVLLDELFRTGTSSIVSYKKCIGKRRTLGLTRVGSHRVVQISAGFIIFFYILGWYFKLLRIVNYLSVPQNFSTY